MEISRAVPLPKAALTKGHEHLTSPWGTNASPCGALLKWYAIPQAFFCFIMWEACIRGIKLGLGGGPVFMPFPWRPAAESLYT